MNNLNLKILEQVYAKPWLTVGGLADQISPGRRTEEEIQNLLRKGYLRNERGLHISEKGLACINSSSLRNRMIRIAKFVLAMAATVVTVVTGNWIWSLIQSVL